MNYSIILPILLGVFIFLGFVFGFFRGTKKTLTRLLLLVLVAFLTGLCSINFIPYVLEFDLARFGIDLGGSTNLKEFLLSFLTNALSEAQMTMTEAQLESLTDFVVSLVSMLISGVLFLVLFVLFKILSMPVYWIINSVLSEVGKGRKKRRFLGALVGVVLGFFLFSVTTLPLTGYLNVVNTVNVATTTETQKGVISSNEMIEDIVYDGYLNNGVYGFMDKIGVVKLQKNAFNKMTTVSFNNGTVTTDLDTEAKAIAKLYNDVLPIVNKAQSGEGLTEADRESITKAVQSLTEVKVFKALRQSTAVKGFSGIASNVANTAISGSGIVLNVEPIINDVFDFLTVSDDTKFSNGINSVIALTFGIMSLTADGSLETIDFEALENLGASFDSVISNEIIKASTIKTFTIDLLDAFKPTIEESVGEGANLTACLNEIKLAIAGAESLSFKSELKAIGKVYEGILSVIPKDGEESSLDGDGIKELGVKLDEACNCGSALINPAVLNVLTAEILKGSNLQETEFISVVFDDLVSKFESKQIVSFANEFNAIAIIYGEVMKLQDGSFESLSKEQMQGFGKSLDEAISCDSKIVDSTIINKLCAELIGDLDLGSDLLDDTIDGVVTKLKNNEVKTFAPEFNAIAELMGLSEEFENLEDVKDLSLDKIGSTIDTIVSYNSVLFDNKVIDDILVSAIKEAFGITEEDETLPDDKKEPLDKAVLKMLKPLEEHKIVIEEDNATPYTKEFTAINDLLGIVDDLDGGELDKESAENMGKTIDVALSRGSKCVQREIINDLIVNSIDEFFNEEDGSTLNGAISEIKKGFGGFKEGPYVNEFNAIAIILDEENSNKLQGGIENSQSAIEVGKLLDDIVKCEGKVITQKVVNTLIVDNLDSYMGSEEGDTFKRAIEEIKTGFDGFNEGLYVTEFTAIGKILDNETLLQSGLNSSSDAIKVGQLLDDVVAPKPPVARALSFRSATIPQPKIITRKVINIVIVDNLKTYIGEEEGSFVNAVEKIKTGFKNFDGKYETEFTAIGKLLDKEESLQNGLSSTTSVELGKTLDEIVESDAKVITREVINIVIVDNIDSSMGSEEGDTFKRAIEEIKTGFDGFGGNYETEFTAIGLMLEEETNLKGGISDSANATHLGEVLDDIVDKGGTIIDRDILNIVIVDNLDSYMSKSEGDGLKKAVSKIKNGFENFDKGLYVTEFTAIGKLLDEKGGAKMESRGDAKKIGEKFDNTIKPSTNEEECPKVITYEVINIFISEALSNYTNGFDASGGYSVAIGDVKSSYENNLVQGNYVNEFDAIGVLIEIEKENESKITADTAIGVGEKFDYIKNESGAVSINYKILDKLIVSIVDETFGKLNDGDIYYGIVNDIKLAFGDDHIVHKSVNSSSYVNEFTAISELMKIQNVVDTENGIVESEKLEGVGEQLDKATQILNVKSVKVETINLMICKVLDNNFASDDNFTVGINEIKKPFNKTTGVEQVNKGEYTKEFTAFAKLLEFKDDNDNIDSETAISIGEKLDVIINPRPKAITYIAINLIIDNIIVDKMPTNDKFNSLKNGIKFNDNSVSETKPEYTKEFTAICDILKAKDNFDSISGENSFNSKASSIGENIDNSLSREAKVITKELIDGYIKNVIDDNNIISIASGDFSGSKAKIKDNLVYVRSEGYKKDDDAYKYTYETEFGYIATLSTISSTYSNIEVGEDNSNLGNALDDIAPSCLVGSCGMDAIISSFKSYEEKEENLKFDLIFTQVDINLTKIAGYGKFGINYDDGEEKYTYLGVINAIDGVYEALNSEDKIVGNTDFNEGVAYNLEVAIDNLEKNNILISVNGARAIAGYLVHEVDLLLEGKVDGLSSMFDSVKDEIKAKIQLNSDLYVKYYNDNLSSTNYDYYITENEMNRVVNGTTIRVNKPFDAIYEKFESIRDSYMAQ